tara:strand:+ start:1178 stop:3535 length:2358 start_codon:yes stop_codon:yes gene_type:complete
VQKIILYIQPQLRSTSTTQDFVRVDLMEEGLIELTQIIQDARDIEKVFTDYSRTFNLPASKTNNKIFKHWYNSDIEGFDNQIFCNARIELNHLHFRIGKIKLEEAVLKNNQILLYKVTFFGNTLTLTDLIGEDKLENLSWLNNFNHSGSNANVKQGLENGLNFTVGSTTYADAIIYPLIAHSQSYIIDSSGNQSNGLNISATGSNLTQRGIVPEDLKPAILVKHIIKAIEQQYSITFKTSEFLDSAAMNNLYLWLHRNKGKLIAPNFKLVNDIAFTCTSASVVCEQFDGTRPDVQFHSNTGIYQFYLYAEDFESRFIYDVTITPESGSASTEYTAQIIDLESNQVVSTIQSVTGTQNISISYGRGTNNPLVVGQVYRLAVKIITNTSFNFDLSINTTYSATAVGGGFDTYTATHTSNSSFITTTADIELINQLPDIKVLDFLRALFSMHNLTAFLNFNGKVVVKTLDSFYSGGDTFDITPFVKTNEHTVGATVPFSEIDFEYAEPKSILAQQFFNTNNRKYGELNYLADTTKSKKYEIKIPFEHMLFERLQDKTSGNLSTVQIGSFLDDNLEPSIGQPLLFYAIYQQNQNNINFLQSTRPETYAALCTVGTPSSINDYWMPHNANELGTSTTPPTYNLNFGSEINTYTLTDYGGTNNSLFQTYYTNYITRVFNKRTRIFKYSAVLPLKVLLNLTLDDLIVIGTRAYTINKMSTKLQSGETSFELLNEPYPVTTTVPSRPSAGTTVPDENTPTSGAFSYSSSNFCINATNPSPTISGTTGGTFTAS